MIRSHKFNRVGFSVFICLLLCYRCQKKEELMHFNQLPSNPRIPDFILESSIEKNDLIGTWSYVNSNCVDQHNYRPHEYCSGNMENSERIVQIDSNFFRLYGYPIERYYEREFKIDSNKINFRIDSLELQEQYLKRVTIAIIPEYNGRYVYLISDSLFLIQFKLGDISYDKFVRRNIETDSLAHLDTSIFDWSRLQTKWYFPPDIKPPVAMECNSSEFLPDTLDLTPQNARNYYFKNQELHFIHESDTIHFEFYSLRGKILNINYWCDGEYHLIHYCCE